jgi:hypothetical protein
MYPRGALLLGVWACASCVYDYSERPPEEGSFRAQCLSGDVPHRRTRDVFDVDSLVSAVMQAAPGDLIRMADGIYDFGSTWFELNAFGTADEPIFLCGTHAAVVQPGAGAQTSINLNGDYWNVVGLTIRDFYWGVQIQTGTGNIFRELELNDTSAYVMVPAKETLLELNQLNRSVMIIRGDDNVVRDNVLVGNGVLDTGQYSTNALIGVGSDVTGDDPVNNVFHRNTGSNKKYLFFDYGAGSKIYCDNTAVDPMELGVNMYNAGPCLP